MQEDPAGMQDLTVHRANVCLRDRKAREGQQGIPMALCRSQGNKPLLRSSNFQKGDRVFQDTYSQLMLSGQKAASGLHVKDRRLLCLCSGSRHYSALFLERSQRSDHHSSPSTIATALKLTAHVRLSRISISPLVLTAEAVNVPLALDLALLFAAARLIPPL